MSKLAKEKKLQIIKAAAKRFDKHGINKTTLNEIARDLRIGKATLYGYFNSKEDIFFSVLEWEGSQYLEEVKSILDELIYLPAEKETYLLASQIYRGCRKRGLTIRKQMDCIIAATCIQNSTFILHNDRDFDNISKYFPLHSLS